MRFSGAQGSCGLWSGGWWRARRAWPPQPVLRTEQGAAGLPGKCTAPVQTQLQLVFLLKSHQTNHRLGVRGPGHSLAVHHRLSGLRLVLHSRGSLPSLENVDVVWGPPASSGSDPAGWVRLQPVGGLMALAAPWPLPHLSEGPQRPCSCWGCLVPWGSSSWGSLY